MQEPQSTGGLARDVWEINHKDIKLTQRLGKGMFGEVRNLVFQTKVSPPRCRDFIFFTFFFAQVWKGVWNERVEVAVKKMRQGTMDPEAFKQEAEVMKTLRHPRLVSLYAVCQGSRLFSQKFDKNRIKILQIFLSCDPFFQLKRTSDDRYGVYV